MNYYTTAQLNERLAQIILETVTPIGAELMQFVNANVAITPVDVHYHTEDDVMCIILQVQIEGCSKFLTTAAQVKDDVFAKYNKYAREVLESVMEVEE